MEQLNTNQEKTDENFKKQEEKIKEEIREQRKEEREMCIRDRSTRLGTGFAIHCPILSPVALGLKYAL